jgi:hypothetical protein
VPNSFWSEFSAAEGDASALENIWSYEIDGNPLFQCRSGDAPEYFGVASPVPSEEQAAATSAAPIADSVEEVFVSDIPESEWAVVDSLATTGNPLMIQYGYGPGGEDPLAGVAEASRIAEGWRRLVDGGAPAGRDAYVCRALAFESLEHFLLLDGMAGRQDEAEDALNVATLNDIRGEALLQELRFGESIIMEGFPTSCS